MERLTRKGEYDFHTLEDVYGYFIPMEEKLTQLEDIEEELGIDLVTLFKALKDGVFYWKGYIAPEDLVIWKGQLYYKPLLKPMFVEMFDFNKYGTDWALTKEELEK